MSYEDFSSLNALDPATPADGASPAELLLAIRQLKTIVKNLLLVSHQPDGRLRRGALSQVADNSVGTLQLINGSVTTEKIGDVVVTEEKIADGSITTSKYGNASIPEAAFSAASIPAQAYKDNSIPLSALAGFITRAFLSQHATNDALRAVVADSIADGAVVDRTISSMSLSKLAGGTTGSFLYKTATGWQAIEADGALTYDPVTAKFTLAAKLELAGLAEAKPKGTDGNASFAATWTTRQLGEIFDTGGFLTTTTNNFKLLAGNYLLLFFCPAFRVGKHQARLFDVTKNVVIVPGTTCYANPGVIAGTPDTIVGDITTSVVIAALEVTDPEALYCIEHWTELAVANGFGQAAGADDTNQPLQKEIFSSGFIVKL